MKRVLIGSILVCSVGNAGEPIPTTLPTPENAPLLTSIVSTSDPKKQEALQTTQKALLMQTGVSSNYQLIVDYFKAKQGRYTKEAEAEVGYFIDNYTFLNSKHVFFVAGTAYVIIVKQQITQSFGVPFVSGMRQSITLGRDTASTGIQWNF